MANQDQTDQCFAEAKKRAEVDGLSNRAVFNQLEAAKKKFAKAQERLSSAKQKLKEQQAKVTSLKDEKLEAEKDLRLAQARFIVQQQEVERQESPTEEDGNQCCICLRPPRNVVISLCCQRIIGCRDCVVKALDEGDGRCPVCRQQFQEFQRRG